MKRLILILIPLLVSAISLSAQTVEISGTVVDSDGETVIGAAVLVAGGGNTGTITDLNGKYTIRAKKKDILVFSALGYEERREDISGRNRIDVVLRSSSLTLNDAVVIGYGVQKKSDLTGSVAVVSADELNSPAFNSVDQALQGRIAGVDIVSGGGEPGAESSIRIRGTRSISAGNDPLIVLDGVIGAVDSYSDINPDDIETVSILKDASSTAVYGARGANGVILVTTKDGTKSPRLKINFNASLGMSELPRKLDLMDAAQFAQWRNDYRGTPAFADPASLGKGTDWQEILTQRALTQKYSLSLSRGNSSQGTYFSLSYDDKPGIVLATGMERLAGRLSLRRTLFKWMKVGMSVSYTWQHRDVNKIHINGTSSNSALSLSPLVGPTDIWNRYADAADSSSSIFNSPYRLAHDETNYSNSHFLNVAPWVEIIPFKGAVLRSTYSYTLKDYQTWYYSPSTLPLADSRKTGGTAARSTSQRMSHLSETTLTWKKTIAKRHNIDLMAGFTAEYNKLDYKYTKGVGYADDNVSFYNMGGVVDKRNLTEDSDLTEVKRMSVLARANYSYRSRYYATFTARYDGSSNFAAGNKWAFFPAGAFKWTVSNEPWMKEAKHNGLSNLSLRLSAGLSGNDAISSYVSQPAIETTSGNWLFGDITQLIAYPQRLGDPSLTWEKTFSVNAGIDVSLLKDRVTMTLDGYMSRTDDLLLQVRNAHHTGFSSRYANIGSTRGWGVEFSIESRNIVKKNFSWRTAFTASHASSIVTDIGNDYEYIATYSKGSQMVFGYMKGYPVNALWGYQYCGVWQNDEQIEQNKITRTYVSQSTTKGWSKYADVNHDGILDKNDMVFLGSSDPVVYGGLQNTFNIYNLELGIFFTYSLGGKIYNISEFKLGTGDTSSNKYTYMVDGAWHAERNPQGNLPSAKATESYASSRFVHDSSFLRLKTLSVSYRFDLTKHVKWLRDISVGAYMDNLFLVTKYNGFDPDVSSSKSVQRLDNATYPNPRSYMLSIKIRY